MTTLTPTTERDPVCGMNVNPATAKHVHEHGGKNYYFCCARLCRKIQSQSANVFEQTLRAGLGNAGNALVRSEARD